MKLSAERTSLKNINQEMITQFNNISGIVEDTVTNSKSMSYYQRTSIENKNMSGDNKHWLERYEHRNYSRYDMKTKYKVK